MAISINSGLKPSSSPPTPPLPNTCSLAKNTLRTPIWWTAASREAASAWQRRCVSAVACVVIGYSTVGFAGAAVLAQQDVEVLRWSDRRACPAWRENSLENVVPENLPRPSDGRRSHGFAAHGPAPAVKVKAAAPYNASCFSL